MRLKLSLWRRVTLLFQGTITITRDDLTAMLQEY